LDRQCIFESVECIYASNGGPPNRLTGDRHYTYEKGLRYVLSYLGYGHCIDRISWQLFLGLVLPDGTVTGDFARLQKGELEIISPFYIFGNEPLKTFHMPFVYDSSHLSFTERIPVATINFDNVVKIFDLATWLLFLAGLLCVSITMSIIYLWEKGEVTWQEVNSS